MEDIVSQHKNTVAALNDQLMTAKQDNQQLKFQLDDARRRTGDERERSDSHKICCPDVYFLSHGHEIFLLPCGCGFVLIAFPFVFLPTTCGAPDY